MSFSFKDQIAEDLKNAFHNTNEFAEMTVFYYDNVRYEIPVILDNSNESDKNTVKNNHAEGIFLYDCKMYCSLSDIVTVPKKGKQIEIGEDFYTIVKVSCEMGEVILYLEMLDE